MSRDIWTFQFDILYTDCEAAKSAMYVYIGPRTYRENTYVAK